MRLIVSTKAWQGDYLEVADRWSSIKCPFETWVVTNNLDDPFPEGVFDKVYRAEDYEWESQVMIDLEMGPERPYTVSEIVELRLAQDVDYLVHFASDVEPPDNWAWVPRGVSLLDTYPIVTPCWEDAEKYLAWHGAHAGLGEVLRTDFGFVDQTFSDQAYLVKPEVLSQKIYNHDHPIKELYPAHGHNSFERRIGQWLADTDQWRAVLKDFTYYHVPKN